MKTLIILLPLLFFSCADKADLNTADVKDSAAKTSAQESAQNRAQDNEGMIAPENDMCICAKDFRPVCGSNGVTYPNACQAGCDDVEDYTEGACEEDAEASEEDSE